MKQPGRLPRSPCLEKIVQLRQMQIHPSSDSLSGVPSLARYHILPRESPVLDLKEQK